MNDIVDVPLGAGPDDHREIVVGQAEDLNLAPAFQGAEHAGDDFDAHRGTVGGHKLTQAQMHDLAPFRIAAHPVERVDEQRLLIAFCTLGGNLLGYTTFTI